MKKQILILAALAFAVFQFWGCTKDGGIFGIIKGSGNIVTVEYNYDNFTKIDVSDAFELKVMESDTFYVKLMIDDNLARYAKVQNNGGWLYIGMVDGHSYNNSHLKAEVHMPLINELEGSGASAITLFSFTDTTDFRLDLSGASVFSGMMAASTCEVKLSGASVINITGTCNDFYLDASGASVVSMNGSCTDLYIDASGASVLDMGNFISNTANIKFSGATEGTIHVLDHLDAILSGASVLKYYGNPTMGNISITGASVITKL
jgi:hypothetical protein